MKYSIIGSSSNGNSIIVEDFILLDCGVSYAKLKKYLKQIKLIFISHVHQDHLLKKTIKQIAYNYPTIKYITGSKKVVWELIACGVQMKNIYVLKPCIWYNLGLLKVRLEILYHDVENYALKWEYKGKKSIYIVDTNSVEHIQAKNYDLYLIESNYKEELLEKHIRECEDENVLYYLNRVTRTHLSYEKANSFLIENMGENSEYDYIHKSSYNFEEENNEII